VPAADAAARVLRLGLERVNRKTSCREGGSTLKALANPLEIAGNVTIPDRADAAVRTAGPPGLAGA
jgi:hypothetical protein